MDEWRAGRAGRFVRRVLDIATGNPQHVLVGFLAATLIVVTGFARMDVDTDPSRVLEPTEFTSSLTVMFDGDRSLMTTPFISAVSGLHRNARDIAGVVDSRILSVASVIRGAIPDTRQAVNALMAEINNDALGGVVVSADRSTMTVVVPLEPEADSISIRSDLLALIAVDDELSTVPHSVAGVSPAGQRVAEDLHSQLVTSVLIGWLLGGLALFAVYRRALLALSATLLIGVTAVWALAIVSALGLTVKVTTSLVPAAVLVIAGLHLIRVIEAVHAHRDTDLAPVKVLTDVGLAAARTAVKADAILIAALAAIAVSSPILRPFALSLVVGIVVALGVSIFVLTAMLASVDAAYYTPRQGEGGNTNLVGAVSRSLPRAGVRFRDGILAVVAVVVGVGAVGLATTSLDDNFLRWLPQSSSEVTSSDHVNDVGIGTTSVTMTLTARHPNQFVSLSSLAAMDALESVWAADPLIGESVSFWKLIEGNDVNERRSSLDTISSTHRLGRSLVDPSTMTANVTVFLRDADGDTTRHLIEVTQEQTALTPLGFGVEVTWSGEGVSNAEWQEEVVRDTAWRLFAGVAALIAAVWLAFRSVRWTVIALAPPAVVYLSTFGLLGWIDGAHGLPSIVAGILLLLIVLDVSLHVTIGYRSASRGTWSPWDAAATVGAGPAPGLVASGLVAGVSCLPLLAADLLPNGRGGVFLLIGAVAGTVLALLLIPATASGPPRNTAPIG